MLLQSELEKNNNKFLEKYCRPDNSKYNRRRPITNPEVIDSYFNTLLLDYENVDQDYIKRYLCSKNYKNFYVLTYWWYIIAHKRKLMDGMACTGKDCDGECLELHVHHPNYDHKGEEIKYMDTITTLCKKCHRKEHNLKEEISKPKKMMGWFKKKNKKVVPPKTEEVEDPKLLEKFNVKMDEMSFQDTTISSDIKKFIITIKTQTLSTEELQKTMLHNLNIWMDVLNEM